MFLPITGARSCPWRHEVIDTTDGTPAEVAALAAAWIRRTLGEAGPSG